ncbi:MAG: DNA polymerase III subunit delta' [Thermovirgaceae bacterium]|nr:DNA polymerase III subunit delta' [Thermovirgaceae bacterium]
MPSQSDLSQNRISQFIRETSDQIGCADAPQAFACVLPLAYHVECALACARKILCYSGTGSDSCPSCSDWAGNSHPDLLFLGKPDEPPGIEDCRRLWGELSLKPVSSRYRIGVLFAAHRMSLPAANSLLKITEETPVSGRVMLLMEENSMLPTLRSRLRVFRFISEDPAGFPEKKVPSGISEYIKWIGQTRKTSPQEISADLEGWVRHFASIKDFTRASRLDVICVLARKGKLTTPMIQDLALAGLEGEVPFEQLFDDFW